MNWEAPLALGIRATTWTASLMVLLLIALGHAAISWYARRKTLKTPAPAGNAQERSERHWLTVTLLRLVAPAALILWIHGLHYALAILLGDLNQTPVVLYGVQALGALRGVGTIIALVWLLSRVGRAVETRLVQFAQHSHTRSDDFFLPIAGTAIRLLLPLLAVTLGTSIFTVPDRLQTLFRNGMSMVLVGAIAYILYRIVDAACDLILERFRIDVANNREARAIHTQVTVLRKLAVSIIVLFAFAAMLMVFDQVRQVGATILASAGVAGIVVGFAAQRSLGMLLAGFQIALTQPIRIDDVVIVEGEWGKIEEITLTYVVVNIWDLRRLIVPITYFLEKPFQNWTRTSVELLATVELYVDYDFPMEPLRQKLTSILKTSRFWNGKVNVLQVTDAREHSVQVRALVSANDAGLAWDLRCEVREGLLDFLQQEHPRSLPRWRVMRAAANGNEPPETPSVAGP